jgi:anthranilate/para-aminobenzoate synthase component I
LFHVFGATACVSHELSFGGDLLDLFELLRVEPYPWLLDSALPSARFGRYSFAGSDPYLVMRARGTNVELDCTRAVRPGLVPGRSVFDADPLEVLRALGPLAPAGTDVAPPFVGGAVGYLGYELAGSKCCARSGRWRRPEPTLPLPSSAVPWAIWGTSSPVGSRISLSAARTTSVSPTSTFSS